MNKFVVQFQQNSDFLSLAGLTLIFNNPLDAIDYFRENKKESFIKDCNFGVTTDTIFVKDFRDNMEYPNCFWAIQPN